MKLAQAIECIPVPVRLTSRMQLPALVTSISFFNVNHSNFLNAFFYKTEPNTFIETENISIQSNPTFLKVR